MASTHSALAQEAVASSLVAAASPARAAAAATIARETAPAGPWKSKPSPNSACSAAASTPRPMHQRAMAPRGVSYARASTTRFGARPSEASANPEEASVASVVSTGRPSAPTSAEAAESRTNAARSAASRAARGAASIAASASHATRYCSSNPFLTRQRFTSAASTAPAAASARASATPSLTSFTEKNLRTPGTYSSATPLGAQHARKPRMPGSVLKVSRKRTSARLAAASQSSLRQLLLPLRLRFAIADAALTILRPSVDEGVVNVHARPVSAWSSAASQPTPALSSGNALGVVGADPGGAAETRAVTSRRARARSNAPRAEAAGARGSGDARGAGGAAARPAAAATRPRVGPAEEGAARPADVRSGAHPARRWARVGARRAPRRAAGVCAADADMTARGETEAREGVRGGNLARDPLRGRARVAQPTPMRRRGRVVRKSET